MIKYQCFIFYNFCDFKNTFTRLSYILKMPKGKNSDRQEPCPKCHSLMRYDKVKNHLEKCKGAPIIRKARKKVDPTHVQCKKCALRFEPWQIATHYKQCQGFDVDVVLLSASPISADQKICATCWSIIKKTNSSTHQLKHYTSSSSHKQQPIKYNININIQTSFRLIPMLNQLVYMGLTNLWMLDKSSLVVSHGQAISKLQPKVSKYGRILDILNELQECQFISINQQYCAQRMTQVSKLKDTNMNNAAKRQNCGDLQYFEHGTLIPSGYWRQQTIKTALRPGRRFRIIEHYINLFKKTLLLHPILLGLQYYDANMRNNTVQYRQSQRPVIQHHFGSIRSKYDFGNKRNPDCDNQSKINSLIGSLGLDILVDFSNLWMCNIRAKIQHVLAFHHRKGTLNILLALKWLEINQFCQFVDGFYIAGENQFKLHSTIKNRSFQFRYMDVNMRQNYDINNRNYQATKQYVQAIRKYFGERLIVSGQTKQSNHYYQEVIRIKDSFTNQSQGYILEGEEIGQLQDFDVVCKRFMEEREAIKDEDLIEQVNRRQPKQPEQLFRRIPILPSIPPTAEQIKVFWQAMRKSEQKDNSQQERKDEKRRMKRIQYHMELRQRRRQGIYSSSQQQQSQQSQRSQQSSQTPF